MIVGLLHYIHSNIYFLFLKFFVHFKIIFLYPPITKLEKKHYKTLSYASTPVSGFFFGISSGLKGSLISNQSFPLLII